MLDYRPKLVLYPPGNIYDKQGTAACKIKELQDLKARKYSALVIKSKVRKLIFTWLDHDIYHLYDSNLFDFPSNCGRVFFERLLELPHEEESI